MAQHKSTLRKSLRSALSHKKLADDILDVIADYQSKLNATLAKLAADSTIALDTDYEASGAITDLFDADGESTEAQHKATLKKSLISALKHKKLAEDILDSLEEVQTSYNALLVKLDSQGGTLTDTDFAATLAVSEVDPDAEGSEAQHKSSFRKTLRSALSHSRLADQIIDAISGGQSSLNSALADLDSGTLASMASYQVTEIDPDSE